MPSTDRLRLLVPSARSLAGLVAAASAAVVLPAHAGYFVATFAQSSINAEGAAIEYGYNIDTFGRLTSSGYQSSGGCALSNCAASGAGSTDVTGRLTSSFDQTQMTSQNLSHDGTQIFNTGATATASANLATGTIGVYAGGSHLDVNGTGGQDGGTGIANAIANDTLHFSIAGADASTITYIGVTYTIDGRFTYAGPGVEASAEVDPYLYLGNASFMASLSANGGATGPTLSGRASNWVSYSISPLTTDLITFTGVYAITGASADLGVQENLNAQCGGGDICDYAHTARLRLNLSDGVSFTSDSGVFLTDVGTVAAVPEPETYALVLAGLGALTWRTRRRTRATTN